MNDRFRYHLNKAARARLLARGSQMGGRGRFSVSRGLLQPWRPVVDDPLLSLLIGVGDDPVLAALTKAGPIDQGLCVAFRALLPPATAGGGLWRDNGASGPALAAQLAAADQVATRDGLTALLALALGKPLVSAPPHWPDQPVDALLTAALTAALVDDPFTEGPATAAQALAWLALWQDHAARNAQPTVAVGFTYWKRRSVARFLRGATAEGPSRVTFMTSARAGLRRANACGARLAIWASKVDPALIAQASVPVVRVEDGFLRSVGIGVNHVPPASLALDPVGIYYDPRHPSRMEELIEAGTFDPALLARAAQLRQRLVAEAVTKYNLSADMPTIVTDKPVILVPGQVEDDASIRTGTAQIRTNLALLARVRAENPDAFIIYKPHPDVEAGLRSGKIAPEKMAALADLVAYNAPAAGLIARADAVWTMTSLLGFEALIRGKAVTCLGAPFYAGWGLTCDRQPIPRRTRRATIDELVAAAYLLYPSYVDPVTRLPCPAEVILARLAARDPRLGRHDQWVFRVASRIWRFFKRLTTR